MSALQASLDTTPPGSFQHGTAALMGLLTMAALCWDGRRSGDAHARSLARRWVWGMLWVQLPLLAVSFHPRWWDVNLSLPLHLCDVGVFLVAGALWTGKRALRACTYFWGLGLSSLAFVTPALDSGPFHLGYWFFWAAHTQVVGGALFDVWVLGFRPRLRDLGVGFGSALVYAAVVMPIDLWLGVNYGFLGREDLSQSGTLLALLPPWPLSVLTLMGVVGAWFAALWLPWALVGGLRSAQARSRPT